MITHIFSVVAFMAVSFTAQGLSHFVINKEHFTSVDFLRSEPILAMGLGVMVLQGLIMSFSLEAWKGDAVQIKDGLFISLIFGLFLVSYIALVEPAKYMVPSIASWARVELTIGTIQFGVFGLMLGWIHSKF